MCFTYQFFLVFFNITRMNSSSNFKIFMIFLSEKIVLFIPFFIIFFNFPLIFLYNFDSFWSHIRIKFSNFPNMSLEILFNPIIIYLTLWPFYYIWRDDITPGLNDSCFGCNFFTIS